MIHRTPSRILMTADTVGGVWSYALDLIKALRRFDIDVLLATMGAPLSSAQQREIAALTNVQIAESTYKLEWMDDPWADIEAAGDWLLDLEREFEPDVIHLNGYSHGSLPWAAPVLVVAHSCVLSWWEAVKGEKAPANWQLYRRRIISGLQAADHVVVPSRAMLHTLLAHYALLPRTQAIPNGRELSSFSPGLKRELIFCAGRLWDEAKNVRTVCAIAPELPWPVVTAGDCAGPDGRETQFPNVRCLGKLDREQIAAWYSCAAIYAHPAKYEPFGLSILEAALSGCALVLGDIPSLRENWEGAALFIHPDDPAALLNALRDLIASPQLRERFALNAQRSAQRFDITRTAKLYRDLYASLTTQSRQPAFALS